MYLVNEIKWNVSTCKYSNVHPGSIKKTEDLLTNSWSTPLYVMFVERGLSIWGRTNWGSAGKKWGRWGNLMDLITRDSFQLIFLTSTTKANVERIISKQEHVLSPFFIFSLLLTSLFNPILWQAEYYRTTSLIKSKKISNSSKSINKSARLST